MSGPWEKFQSAPDAEGPWARFSAAEAPKEQYTATDSVARGAAQGATLGFADEIAGGVEALWEKAKGDPKEFGQLYKQYRDESRANFDAAKKANPKAYGAGEIGAAIGTAFIPGMGLAKGASLGKVALQSAALGGVGGAGYSTADNPEGVAKDAATGAAVAGALGAGVAKAAPLVGDAVSSVGGKIKGFAEKTAVNATGATGKQASSFADNAGRELLDRGIVRFGDSQEKIAARAADAVNKANGEIDAALTKLEKNGVKVDANAIYDTVQTTIQKMKADPSKADVAKMLEGELDNLINSTQAKGSTQFGVSEAEQIKRGFNRKAGNWADPEKSMTGKEMYQTWRKAVENAAENSDPATAKVFEEAKKSYGLLAPIEEAAGRRAATTAQSPPVGLLDVSTAGAGMLTGIPGGALLAPVARRLIAPRTASSIAVAADKLGNAMIKSSGAAAKAAGSPRLVETVGEYVRPTIPKRVNSANVSENDAPQKGPAKWANDGANKLKEHSRDPASASAIEAAAKDPSGKDLLIQASDLKPGSKAMDALLEKIRKKYGNSVSGH